MAIDAKLLECNSNSEREVALHVLQGLVDLLGDPTTMTIDLWQLHRVILVMRGIVTEADPQLSSDADFDRVAAALADMIAKESKNARAFRRDNGIGLLDLVLGSNKMIH